jgi:hypothetical protein
MMLRCLPMKCSKLIGPPPRSSSSQRNRTLLCSSVCTSPSPETLEIIFKQHTRKKTAHRDSLFFPLFGSALCCRATTPRRFYSPSFLLFKIARCALPTSSQVPCKCFIYSQSSTAYESVKRAIVLKTVSV